MAYVTTATIRAIPNLADTAIFPDAALTAAISWFETTFEDYTGVAWETRTVTAERHDGTATSALILDHMYPRSITAVSVVSDAGASTLFTAGELADLRLDSSGVIRRVSLGYFTRGAGNVLVDYTHAKTATAPVDVTEAAKVAIRDHLLGGQQGTRVYAVQTQDGIVRSSTPGPDRPFGIPEVDAVANRRCERIPGVA